MLYPMADTVDQKTVYPVSRSYLVGVISHILLKTHDTFSCSFPDDSDGKESVCNAGDLSSITWLGGSPFTVGERHGFPLPIYFCLENSMDRRAWWATVYGVTKSQIQLRK